MESTERVLYGDGIETAHFPNRADWDDAFWRNKYAVRLSAQGVLFFVNADNEQDALDYVIDACEENHPGLLLDDADMVAMTPEELDEHLCGGNHCRYLSTHNVSIEAV